MEIIKLQFYINNPHLVSDKNETGKYDLFTFKYTNIKLIGNLFIYT